MATNPFSTRFIRPGAIPFLFAGDESAAALVGRLQKNGWWGQIIGPHGSGKSTLLTALKPELEAAGRQVLEVTLHRGEHQLPQFDRRSLTATTQVVIDGYEQLSWWSRWGVKSLCGWHRAGLLVTTHVDVGLPTIFRSTSSEQVVRAIVERLLGNSEALITGSDVAAAYEATGGNVRETLFRLYDVYQHKAMRPTAR